MTISRVKIHKLGISGEKKFFQFPFKKFKRINFFDSIGESIPIRNSRIRKTGRGHRKRFGNMVIMRAPAS